MKPGIPLASALAAVCLLAGCGPSPAELRAADRGRCQDYGFAPETDAFARCMMTHDIRREDQDAADRRAMARQRQLQQQQDDRVNAERREELMAPPPPPPGPPRDPFYVPGGLQIPAPAPAD